MSSGGRHGSFADRLRKVIDDRKIAPWARRMGIADGTRSRMLKDGGIPPTYDLLTRMMVVENVNISWLLGGNDARYRVCRTSSDAHTSEALYRLLVGEDGRQVHLLVSGQRAAWLLVRQAEVDHPKGAISYWEIEVIAGPVGSRSVAVLGECRGGTVQGVHTLPTRVMEALYEGRLGTWQLVGQPDDPAAGIIDARVSQSVQLGQVPAAPLVYAEGGEGRDLREALERAMQSLKELQMKFDERLTSLKGGVGLPEALSKPARGGKSR